MMDLITLPASITSLDEFKGGISYSERQNAFITSGYRSFLGNVYYKSIRLSDRIVVVTDIGIGYWHTFLNKITLYSNLTDKKGLIGQKSYHNYKLSEDTIKRDAKKILWDQLILQSTAENYKVDPFWLESFIEKTIEDTYENQIEIVKTMLANRMLP